MTHGKNILRILIGFAALFAVLCATSCEEEMKDFEVETAQSRLVIDAECNAMKGAITVRLSRTVSFVSSEKNPPVSGATITLRYNSTTLNLIEMSEGLYVAYALFPEKTRYELTVEAEGETYTATSYMPQRVNFTDVTYEKITHNPMFPSIEYGGDTTYMVTLSFLDPQAEDNFYRVVIYRNDTLAHRDLTIMNDTYFTADTIHYSPWQRFYENDVLSLELRSFDRTAYRFYSSMQAAMEAGGAFSVPDNPISNFSGGALGHFTAFSGDKYTLALNRLE
ncbi:MAG: DUF4249 domain-containing protein [Bacteroidales bacterium]|jgi:hypothetical protein|nr:DUF4249 domain-containing protein [Bacteroidales bacterium]